MSKIRSSRRSARLRCASTSAAKRPSWWMLRANGEAGVSHASGGALPATELADVPRHQRRTPDRSSQKPPARGGQPALHVGRGRRVVTCIHQHAHVDAVVLGRHAALDRGVRVHHRHIVRRRHHQHQVGHLPQPPCPIRDAAAAIDRPARRPCASSVCNCSSSRSSDLGDRSGARSAAHCPANSEMPAGPSRSASTADESAREHVVQRPRHVRRRCRATGRRRHSAPRRPAPYDGPVAQAPPPD